MKVTKRFRFESSHYLEAPELTVEENIKLFGQCSGFRSVNNTICGQRKMHGHSYKMEVTVKGDINEQTGFVINFSDLNNIVRNCVINRLDHECLNDIMDMKWWPVTVEKMLLWIVKETLLLQTIHDVTLKQSQVSSIKIWETEDSFAEWVNPKNEANHDS